MHCSNCGKDNDEGTRVCPWCGTRMSPIAKPRPKRKAAIAAAAVLIIIAACFVIYIDGDKPENRASFIDPNTPGNSDITVLTTQFVNKTFSVTRVTENVLFTEI